MKYARQIHQKTARPLALLALAAFAISVSSFASPARNIFAGASVMPVVAHGTQGYLGVDIRDVTDERARALKLKEARGAEICVIDHDGPAIKAGLRENDVILQMNGQPVEGEEQLRRMLRETPAGHTVSFVYSRDGQTHTASVQLGDRDEVARRAWEQHFAVPEPPPEDATIPDPMNDPQPGPPPAQQRGYLGFGFMGPAMISNTYTGAMLDALGPQLAQFFGAKPGTGLLVKSIDSDSPAARAGLLAGDVVVRVNGKPVSTKSDWLHAIQSSHGKTIGVTVLRDKREQTLNMALGGKKHSELLLMEHPAWVLAHFYAHHAPAPDNWI
ncbi:MAG: PDZ domain-containing protein [Acidobacteriaceae bacterium]|jgi:S1-C subfamily serine protease|nr:PDZ domain-containing protein [Acidobacteriaceae bacterium]